MRKYYNGIHNKVAKRFNIIENILCNDIEMAAENMEK